MKKNLILILLCMQFLFCDSLFSCEKKKADDLAKINSNINQMLMVTMGTVMSGTASILNLGLVIKDLLYERPSYCYNNDLLQTVQCSNGLFPGAIIFNNCDAPIPALMWLKLGLSVTSGLYTCCLVHKLKKYKSKIINLKKQSSTGGSCTSEIR